MPAFADQYGYFFDSQSSDRTYNASSFEDWLTPFFTTGVFSGGFLVTAQNTPDMTVEVSPGFSNINGKVGRFSNATTLQIATASGVYDRIDTVVLRRDNTSRCISLEVVTGIAAAEPEPAAPQRTADIYELVIAQILVGTGATEIQGSAITDTRADLDLCGIVAATITEMDFEQFTLQFDSFFKEFKINANANWTSWAAAEKEAFELWESNQKSDYDTWEAARTAAFNAWFAGIQDTLDGDTAGHLLNLINYTRDGILQNTQNKTTIYDGNVVRDIYGDGHYDITTYNGNTVTEQMYDGGNVLLWTKTTTYNGNTVQEVIS